MAIFNSKLTISMAIFYISGPWLKVGSTAAPEALEVDPKPSQKQKQSSAGQGVPWPGEDLQRSYQNMNKGNHPHWNHG